MSYPIQALAPGFLGLLGLKNNGALPPMMIDALSPVIDALPFYLQGSREVLPQSAAVNILAANANYGFAEYVVPAGEVWYVHAFHVLVTVPAAQSWVGYGKHVTPGFGDIHVSGVASAGGAAIQAAITPDIGGFFAAAGDRFGVFTGASAGAGAVNASGVLTISRYTA